MPVVTYRCDLKNLVNSGAFGFEAIVRPADTPADAAAIRQVVETCQFHDGTRRSPAGLVPELTGRPGRSVRRWLALAGGDACGLVAVVVTGEAIRRRHSIAWLLVSDHARRRGVGRALVVTAAEAARQDGARELWVQTRSEWQAADSFWRSVGFHEPS